MSQSDMVLKEKLLEEGEALPPALPVPLEAPAADGEEVEVKSESHVRSFLKGFTWRITATTTTVIISYFVTGDVAAALEIGAIEFFIKILIYYVHERLWLLCKVCGEK